MDTYIISLTIIGAAALGMAWMPAISEKTGISYSILYVLIGVALYSLFDGLPWPDPIWQEEYAVHLTELVVIISLMGTGLKIDQLFSFRTWQVPFRLVTITMLLGIAFVSFLGWWSFGFDIASALLLGAVLAPTDPVLASDVQVGPPNEKQRDNIRFSLTAEAGLNDGMAFPFTWLAITAALLPASGDGGWGEWVLYDLFYRVIIGIVCGLVIGRLLAYLLFYLPAKRNFMVTRDGFVAISVTLFAYGITELVHGYGFIAVFVTAVAMRNYKKEHEYHRELHSFTDQVERMLLAILLILFGGSLVTGLLDNLTWEMAFFVLLFILVIRPLTGLLGLIGTKLHFKEKLAISFFGIKGIGSFFYLAFALTQAEFKYREEIWSMVAFTVLISILIHGVTASISMRKIQKQLDTENGNTYSFSEKPGTTRL